MEKTNSKKTVINMTAFAAILLLTSSIVRVGACLYLPALPVIGKDLGISDADMGLTVTVYFMTFSLFILISGPFSDAFGRRSLIIIGATIFIIGSFICGMANSNAHLLLGRIIQALGASMIPGTARAMIRDIGTDAQVVSLMGWMAVLGGLLLVAAPILGGVITELCSWRYNFWFLVIFSIAALAVILYHLPETLAHDKRIHLNLKPVLHTYKTMIISSRFSLVIMPIVLCFAIQGSYIVAAPFIFMKSFMMTPTQFGLSNIVIVLALMGGRYISMHTIKHHSGKTAYITGALIILTAGILFAIIALRKYENIYILLAAISVFGLGFGVLSPIGLKSSITAFRKTSGMAAALQGCLLLGGTALGSAGITFILKFFPEMSPMNILAVSAAILASLVFISALTGKNRLV